ncbi:DNA repair protein RecO [bacterium]|nr:MAG: DNA repair protein RecO [bacterium]
MIVKTDGVVLGRKELRETSLMLDLFTRRLGRISAVAKGARRPGSRFGGALDFLCVSEFVIYSSERRDVQYVSDATLLDGMEELKENLERFWAASFMVAAVKDTVHGRDERIYNLFLTALRLLKREKGALFYFLLSLYHNLGVGMLHNKEINLEGDERKILKELSSGVFSTWNSLSSKGRKIIERKIVDYGKKYAGLKSVPLRDIQIHGDID